MNEILKTHNIRSCLSLAGAEFGHQHLRPARQSRLHKAFEAGFERRLARTDSGELARLSDSLDTAHVFVVQHNWAAALDPAIGEEQDFKLPYPRSIFEFLIDGCAYLLILEQFESGPELGLALLMEKKDGTWQWVQGVWSQWQAYARDYLLAQVRALCVALESQIARASHVQAPAKLNAKRAKTGKPALNDYHVVDLSMRSASGGGDRKTGTVRMHFRRGHWRHLEDHKVWVTWTLVGNPDLGWVDKEYRL